MQRSVGILSHGPRRARGARGVGGALAHGHDRCAHV